MSDRPPRAPAERLAHAARAAHDLSDALWESLHDELSSAQHAERAAELARRLADVCSAIALLATPAAPGASAPAMPAHSTPALAPEAQPPAQSPLEPPEPAHEAGIEVHDTREDARREDGPSAWVGSISRRLARHREDRLPFAVLLIEVLDIDRLAHAEPQEVTRLTAHVERAIASELRPADLLAHEALGRYWLVTPETDAAGARHLAERLARTVRLAAQHRGAPLELAIGIAICPEDGRDASELAAHADVGVYAARAAGQPVAPADDPAA